MEKDDIDISNISDSNINEDFDREDQFDPLDMMDLDLLKRFMDCQDPKVMKQICKELK